MSQLWFTATHRAGFGKKKKKKFKDSLLLQNMSCYCWTMCVQSLSPGGCFHILLLTAHFNLSLESALTVSQLVQSSNMVQCGLYTSTMWEKASVCASPSIALRKCCKSNINATFTQRFPHCVVWALTDALLLHALMAADWRISASNNVVHPDEHGWKGWKRFTLLIFINSVKHCANFGNRASAGEEILCEVVIILTYLQDTKNGCNFHVFMTWMCWGKENKPGTYCWAWSLAVVQHHMRKH